MENTDYGNRSKWLTRFHLLPDFLIIGAQKGGTTSLYDNLSRHPQVRPARVKEIQYFDWNYSRGLDWYRGHFPRYFSASQGAPNLLRPWITGEASPYYLRSFQAPSRLRETCDKTGVFPRLIVLLRDPVSRAYSHYQMTKNQYEAEDLSFADALAAEASRLEPEITRMRDSLSYTSMADILFGYTALGHYAEQLGRWFALFPRESFLIVQSEAFNQHPESTYARITDFLRLPRWQPTSYQRSNVGSYPPMDSATANLLRDHFAEPNRRLFDLIEESFDWSNTA